MELLSILLICVVKIKYHCSFPREEADTQAGKLSWGTTRLKPETRTFSQRYRLWWKQGRALFTDWFPNTGKAFNAVFSAEEKKSLHGTSKEAVLCLRRVGDRGGGTRGDTPVPVKRSQLSAHKAA